MNQPVVEADPTQPSLRMRLGLGAGMIALALLAAIVLAATRPKAQIVDQARRAIAVRVFTAHRQPVRRQWHGYGTVQPVDAADVPAQVAATVRRVPEEIRPGRLVQRGQLLMELDDADFLHEARTGSQRLAEIESQRTGWTIEKDRLTAQLELDDADLALAQAEYDRVKRITEQLAGNQQQLDQAQRSLLAARRAAMLTREALDQMTPRRLAVEAQLEAQLAQLERARLNVARCRVQSPLTGVLSDVDADDGEQVQPGTRVARVVNLQRVQIPLQLAAAARRTLAVGDAAAVRVTADRGQTCQAAVCRIHPVDDPATRTVTVYVEVDQHLAAETFGSPGGAELLMPGTFVSGVVTSQASAERWIVPRRSIRGDRVQIVRDGVLGSRAVEVDFVLEGAQPALNLPDTQWAVLVGDDALNEGDQVLLDGSANLPDGQPVEATPPVSAADSASDSAAGGGSEP